MYRVTTPTHTYTLPIETSSCKEILVSYRQNNVVLEKHYQDGTLPSGMTLNGNDVIVNLTQAETKEFSKGKIDAQVRVLTNANKAFASQIFTVTHKDVINEEILE